MGQADRVDKCCREKEGAGVQGVCMETAVLNRDQSLLKKVSFESRLELGDGFSNAGIWEYSFIQAAGIAKASEKQGPTQTSGRGHPKDKESEKGPRRGRKKGLHAYVNCIVWLPCWVG